MRTVSRALFLLLGAVALPACGHSEEEWQVQVDRANRAILEKHALERRTAQAERTAEEDERRVQELSKQLAVAGVGEEGAPGMTGADRQRAEAQFIARARQLENARARYEILKKRLDDVSKQGVYVTARKNRMTIMIPGDTLFDNGRDALKKDGAALIAKIGAAIKSDGALASRDLDVACDTDNKPLGPSGFKDNLGLSAMRARAIAAELATDKGGGLSKAHLAVTGYADSDPIAPNDTDEGKKRNRRCEIVVVPTADEVLDLESTLAL